MPRKQILQLNTKRSFTPDFHPQAAARFGSTEREVRSVGRGRLQNLAALGDITRSDAHVFAPPRSDERAHSITTLHRHLGCAIEQPWVCFLLGEQQRDGGEQQNGLCTANAAHASRQEVWEVWEFLIHVKAVERGANDTSSSRGFSAQATPTPNPST
jgi:hypothetical protein